MLRVQSRASRAGLTDSTPLRCTWRRSHQRASLSIYFAPPSCVRLQQTPQLITGSRYRRPVEGHPTSSHWTVRHLRRLTYANASMADQRTEWCSQGTCTTSVYLCPWPEFGNQRCPPRCAALDIIPIWRFLGEVFRLLMIFHKHGTKFTQWHSNSDRTGGSGNHITGGQ